ncbi:MAG: hypothetical protein V7L23_23055 [Nostoc sp.]|uniref:hypothetical protein n=1 Tax=Nostoc sp. TaxID=1180 RepID=UPI002FEEAB3F
MLRLNSKQLNYLIYIQGLDDWHPLGLLQEIPKHKENFAGDESELNSLLAACRSNRKNRPGE